MWFSVEAYVSGVWWRLKRVEATYKLKEFEQPWVALASEPVEAPVNRSYHCAPANFTYAGTVAPGPETPPFAVLFDGLQVHPSSCCSLRGAPLANMALAGIERPLWTHHVFPFSLPNIRTLHTLNSI